MENNKPIPCQHTNLNGEKCGTSIEWFGKGRRPKYCPEHKALLRKERDKERAKRRVRTREQKDRINERQQLRRATQVVEREPIECIISWCTNKVEDRSHGRKTCILHSSEDIKRDKSTWDNEHALWRSALTVIQKHKSLHPELEAYTNKEILGISSKDEYVKYITDRWLTVDPSQFTEHDTNKIEKMSWNNRNRGRSWAWDWDVEHINPISMAEDAYEMMMLLHYSNMTPMFHCINLYKRDYRLDIDNIENMSEYEIVNIRDLYLPGRLKNIKFKPVHAYAASENGDTLKGSPKSLDKYFERQLKKGEKYDSRLQDITIEARLWSGPAKVLQKVIAHRERKNKLS